MKNSQEKAMKNSQEKEIKKGDRSFLRSPEICLFSLSESAEKVS